MGIVSSEAKDGYLGPGCELMLAGYMVKRRVDTLHDKLLTHENTEDIMKSVSNILDAVVELENASYKYEELYGK